MRYDFSEIEKKWQRRWREDPYFAVGKNIGKPKYYCLDMFPYPSGSGLHLGHWRGYVLSDVYSRIKLLQGFKVLHPMGWDAFGLPAENAAIKEGIHPKILTERNIKIFKKQLEKMGAVFDWSHEINTTDPKYYKWTQWIFLKMFDAGLAYQQEIPVNWCPKCLTGLANEEASGGTCERCGSKVEQKPLRQWVLRITKYAEQLNDDLDKLDWPDKVKLMQRNWIGKSYGVNINFESDAGIITVYTTRPDTLFGCTFILLAPEHELVEKLTTPEQKTAVCNYVESVKNMTNMERQLDREKTGVFTGGYAINPANGERIPVYVSSYVIKDYGTGAIMCVPAHDQRDFEFAVKFGLPIKQVIVPDSESVFFSQDGKLLRAIDTNGKMVNSGEFDGLDAFRQGKEEVIRWLEKREVGKRKVNYRLRDWIFSRQRYWGEPIPLVHCDGCGVVGVPEEQLPVKLPEVDKYEPTGTGESPLANIKEWVNTKCPKCSGPAKRETNTMPQWAGSCWYFLRFVDPSNDEKIFDPVKIREWLPVDLYVGGIEHAVLHLLYARFYVKFLHELGYLPFNEPFKRLFNQGMVCMRSPKTGRVEKMSKSKGNVVNPDEITNRYGSDALRLYVLFMGPPDMDCEWSEASVTGVYNFLGRLWAYLCNKDNILPEGCSADLSVQKRYHLFLKEYQKRLEQFKTNTAVSAIMELLNFWTDNRVKIDRVILRDFLSSISVMVPHFASELLEKLLGLELKDMVWPEVDESLAVVDEVVIAVQVNGKVRGTIKVMVNMEEEEIVGKARVAVSKWVSGRNISKVIFVKSKLVNFVVN